jgi:hypothetical protein
MSGEHRQSRVSPIWGAGIQAEAAFNWDEPRNRPQPLDDEPL